jgi:hypothetical protein
LAILCNGTWIKVRARKIIAMGYKSLHGEIASLFESGKRITERVGERTVKVALLMLGNGSEKFAVQ